ncbi:DUF2505 domain-containing protein [Terrabacter terrigena]|uniref:DUF2505 domain-containing protein n=1 Tax=Terrabacter terrigena TaxID=574718 RepID=A0ABW3MUD7_9MICO
MRITETITYAAPPETVYEMVTDQAFQERKCVEAGAQRHEAAVSAAGDGARVVTKRDLPADDLPDFAKSIVGPTLSVTETYEWAGASGDGGRAGTLTVEVAGAPVAMRSKIRLAPAGGGGSEITIDGDLKASIPLFGGKVEKAAAPAVIDAIRSEQRTGTAWLAERG